jgi:T-complex protein 1 subunit gamma
MLKMLMDPMGGIVMTNDGNAILREITVQHPAAKTMIEIARTQVTFDNIVSPTFSR